MKEIAFQIVSEAFEGKVDKGGHPYIDHLVRVAENFPEDEVLYTVGLLHDLLEDIRGYFIEQYFTPRICTAVYVLTRNKGEDWEEYIERLSENEDAVKVKIADLKDNLNLSRIVTPLGLKDMLRVEKYHRTYLRLLKFKD